MKEKILDILMANQDKFTSGEELSQSFGVSRTAVWKAIKGLKDRGYVIESVSHKGYKLLSLGDDYSKEGIQKALGNSKFKDHVIYFDSLTSTSDHVKKIASEGASDFTVVIANRQTAGRGRLGRTWESEADQGIFMSILLRPSFSPNHASKITQLIAASVVEGLNFVTNLRFYIKWPNDIILNEKKISGILTEMNSEMNAIHYICVGIGINVNNKNFPDEVANKATSIFNETKVQWDRKNLIVAVLNSIEKYYLDYLENSNDKMALNLCRENSITIGREVIATSSSGEIRGRAVALSDEGELIIETEDGSRVKIFYGEISVRGPTDIFK